MVTDYNAVINYHCLRECQHPWWTDGNQQGFIQIQYGRLWLDSKCCISRKNLFKLHLMKIKLNGFSST